jgi:hypothetical protein
MSGITYTIENYTSSNGMVSTTEYQFTDGERWVKTTTEYLATDMVWRKRTVVRVAEFPGDNEKRTTVGALTAKLAASDGFTPGPAEAPDADAIEQLVTDAEEHNTLDTFKARYGIVHADEDGRAVRVIILDGMQFTPFVLNELAYAALAEWQGRAARDRISLGLHGVTPDGHIAVQVTRDEA